MPTYDYLCKACGHTLELFQSMTERAKRKCPECGAPKLERQIGPGAGFVFKGSGFYQTDYRSKSYEEGKAKESETKADAGSGSASKKKSESGSGAEKTSKPKSKPEE